MGDGNNRFRLPEAFMILFMGWLERIIADNQFLVGPENNFSGRKIVECYFNTSPDQAGFDRFFPFIGFHVEGGSQNFNVEFACMYDERLCCIFNDVEESFSVQADFTDGISISTCLLYTSPSPRDRQ